MPAWQCCPRQQLAALPVRCRLRQAACTCSSTMRGAETRSLNWSLTMSFIRLVLASPAGRAPAAQRKGWRLLEGLGPWPQQQQVSRSRVPPLACSAAPVDCSPMTTHMPAHRRKCRHPDASLQGGARSRGLGCQLARTLLNGLFGHLGARRHLACHQHLHRDCGCARSGEKGWGGRRLQRACGSQTARRGAGPPHAALAILKKRWWAAQKSPCCFLGRICTRRHISVQKEVERSYLRGEERPAPGSGHWQLQGGGVYPPAEVLRCRKQHCSSALLT